MIHYAGSKKEALELKAALFKAGFERIHMRKTNSTVRRTELRYFDVAYQGAAERLGAVDNRLAAARINIVPIEAAPGLVEIWLKGRDIGEPVVNQTTKPVKQQGAPADIVASVLEGRYAPEGGAVLIGPVTGAPASGSDKYVPTAKMQRK